MKSEYLIFAGIALVVAVGVTYAANNVGMVKGLIGPTA